MVIGYRERVNRVHSLRRINFNSSFERNINLSPRILKDNIRIHDDLRSNFYPKLPETIILLLLLFIYRTMYLPRLILIHLSYEMLTLSPRILKDNIRIHDLCSNFYSKLPETIILLLLLFIYHTMYLPRFQKKEKSDNFPRSSKL